nr:zinc finger protein 2-like [Dermacentor andersoni]
MAGKETARPYFTMSGCNCNVGEGTSSAASDLDISRKSPPRRSVRDEATVARKETARPYFTMSSGHYNLAQGTSSAPYDLDECRVPGGTRQAAFHQRDNQVASRIQQCGVCRFVFTDTKAFQQHAAHHLLGKNNCYECGKLFMKPCDVKRHLRMHGEPSFECSVCGQKFYSVDERKYHMLSCHVGVED